MHRLPVAAAFAALSLLAPAAAHADAPWPAPTPIPGGSGLGRAIASTPAAGTALATTTTSAGSPLSDRAQLTQLDANGSVVATRPIPLFPDVLASYAQTRIAAAGRSLGADGTYGPTSRVELAFGTPAGLGTPHALPGTTGQGLFGMAANAKGAVAVVTGPYGAGTRALWIRRAGSSTTRRVLSFRVGSRARGAQVAVGASGEVLMTYEDDHHVYARHVGTKGTVGAIDRIGDGIQSAQQPVVDDDGRLSVAWSSQRVGEGDAATGATVSFATAAPGHGFGPARKVTTGSSPTGTGRYVAAPVLRLVRDGDGRDLLAYSDYDGTRFAVRAREIASGHLGAPQSLSDPAVDMILADASAGPSGGAVVLMRTGVAGADALPGATPGLAASVRDTGASTFGGVERVSPAGTPYVDDAAAAIDPTSGRAIAAFSTVANPPGVFVSSR